MKVVRIFRSWGVKSVLDACCGAGTLSRYLRSAGMNVTAADLSPSMLEIARHKAPDVRFIQSDMAGLQLARPVDGSVIALSLHEMAEEERSVVWHAMRGLTRVGGPLIVVDYAWVARRTFSSRIAEWIIWKDEASLGKNDPHHYDNFKAFMAIGGAKGWLERGRENIVMEVLFLYGNLGVFVVANDDGAHRCG
jgi:SAM-dependent methyltransferase